MSSWDEYPLAGRLRVEEPVGVFRLLEREAVGEKALERELAACNETRAFFLADSAERPRGVDVQRCRPRRMRAFHCRSEEHTSELQSRLHLVCRLLLEKK